MGSGAGQDLQSGLSFTLRFGLQVYIPKKVRHEDVIGEPWEKGKSPEDWDHVWLHLPDCDSMREGLFTRQTGTQQTTQLKKQRVLSWNPANLTRKPCLSLVHLGQAGCCGRGGGGPGGVHLGVCGRGRG